MKILGTFTVKDYRELYSLELDELHLRDFEDEDLLTLVEYEYEEGPCWEVQYLQVEDRAFSTDEVPFELVQGQEVVEEYGSGGDRMNMFL